MDPTADFLTKALLYGLMPLWLLAGFADYLCHRVLRIEYSAGVKEAGLHLMLLTELGAGLLALVLFQINALVLALLLVLCFVHELTTWWDLNYAAARRTIPVPEQWVHGLQQMLPWVGLAGLMVLHPGQTLALAGLGSEAPDWSLRLRPPPIPLPYLLAVIAAALGLVLLPFLAEYRRCRKKRILAG